MEEDPSEHEVHDILFPKESLQATLTQEKQQQMRLAAMNKNDEETSSRPSVMSARKNQEELKKASMEKQKAMRAQFDESWDSFRKRFGEEL